MILTLALGIGANAAIFSVFRGLLLRPLPHGEESTLLYLTQSAAQVGQQDVNFSVPEILDFREQSRTPGSR